MLDAEKITHLKEQLYIMKYRASCAEERVTRLLQFRERNVKNSHDKMREGNASASHRRVGSLQNRGGTRSRLSDTLDLLTEPLWESDPDPDAEWVVLKVLNGNDFYFMADFVDGDIMDGSEWLEGPFDQAITVTNLLDIKRRGRAVRRERGSSKTGPMLYLDRG
jgi:hypothetical protein